MISNEVSGDGAHVKDEPAEEMASPPSIMATPKKRGATKPSGEASPTKKPKTPVSGKKAALPGIPTCKAEITEPDRVLIEMREAGASWGAITAAFEEIIGVKVGGTTCRLRFGKLKANLACVEEKDMDTLRGCVAKVEADIEEQVKSLQRKKWAQVSAGMMEAGTVKYEPGTIEKAYKNLGVNGNHAASMTGAVGDEDE